MTAVEGISVAPEGFLRIRVTPHNARTRARTAAEKAHIYNRAGRDDPKAMDKFERGEKVIEGQKRIAVPRKQRGR